MDQMSTSTMMENSSFQVRDVIATVSDATSTSCSLDTLPSIQEASSNFKVTNSNETTVTGTISVVHSHEKNLGTPSTAMFVPDPTTTDKQDACSEVKRERPIVQPTASSTSPQNEEYWVLPPKRKPGRKPSRPGQPKRNSQLEEKGSMEYLLKRARNNIAIRKCREKAKSRQEETDKMLMQLQLENSQLKKENSELKHSLAALQKELDILKKR